MWYVYSFLLSGRKLCLLEVWRRYLKGVTWKGTGVEGWQVLKIEHLRKKELPNKFGSHFLAVNSTVTSCDF